MQNTSIFFIVLLAISSAFFIGLDMQAPTETAEACGGIGNYFKNSKEGCVPAVTSLNKDRVTEEGGLRDDLEPVINTTVAILLAFGVVNIVYGALEFTLAGLDINRAERAKRRLFLTFIGIVLLMSVYSVYRLVYSLVIGS